MKNLNLKQMESICAKGDGQDLVGGILCGIALGSAIPTGGISLLAAVGSCAILFGNW